MIRINDLTCRYNDKVVFKNLNYTFYENKLYVIKGPNGSGKTSLIRCIMNTINYSGSITFSDKSSHENLNDYLINNISLIDQRNDLFSYLSVIDNLKFASFVKNINNYDIDRYLTLFSIKHLAKRKVESLSGGEQKIVSLIKCLLSNTRTIILDELTTSLNDNMKIKIMELLNSIKKDHIIILITHSEKVEDYADEILDMSKIEGFINSEDYGFNSSNNVTKIYKLQNKKVLKLLLARNKLVSLLLIFLLSIISLTAMLALNGTSEQFAKGIMLNAKYYSLHYINMENKEAILESDYQKYLNSNEFSLVYKTNFGMFSVDNQLVQINTALSSNKLDDDQIILTDYLYNLFNTDGHDFSVNENIVLTIKNKHITFRIHSLVSTCYNSIKISNGENEQLMNESYKSVYFSNNTFMNLFSAYFNNKSVSVGLTTITEQNIYSSITNGYSFNKFPTTIISNVYNDFKVKNYVFIPLLILGCVVFLLMQSYTIRNLFDTKKNEIELLQEKGISIKNIIINLSVIISGISFTSFILACLIYNISLLMLNKLNNNVFYESITFRYTAYNNNFIYMCIIIFLIITFSNFTILANIYIIKHKKIIFR